MLTVDALKSEVEKLGFFEMIRFSEWVAQHRASRKVSVYSLEKEEGRADQLNPDDIAQTDQQPENSNDDFSIDYSKLETKRSALGNFKLHYKDSSGSISCREINLRNVFRKGEVLYFSAYCHLRKQVKTFRTDRVIMLEDLDNDMIFDKDLDVFFAARLLAV